MDILGEGAISKAMNTKKNNPDVKNLRKTINDVMDEKYFDESNV